MKPEMLPEKTGERGFILVTSLIVVILMTGLILGFVDQVRTEQLIAGNDRFSELRVIYPDKVGHFFMVVFVVKHERAGQLSHGLDYKHARHNRVSGKVPLEKKRVLPDKPFAYRPLFFLDLANAVQEKKRFPVRKYLLNIGSI